MISEVQVERVGKLTPAQKGELLTPEQLPDHIYLREFSGFSVDEAGAIKRLDKRLSMSL